MLDNAAVFGGVAKRNEFVVDGHRLYAPQASVHFQPPYPHSFLKGVYDAMGLDFNAFKDHQTWRGPSPEIALTRSPYRVLGMEEKTYGFYFGAKFGHTPGVWVVDPWGKSLEGCPFPEKMRQEMLAWRRGRRVEEPWRYKFPGDETSRKIDSITLEEYYIRTLGLDRDTVRLLFTHDTAGGLGLGPDALSGFCEYAWSSVTLFVDFAKPGLPAAEEGHRGRAELLSTSYRDYERVIREQMDQMFSASGFDAGRNIAGIVLNRWGHAFINPQPGFFFGADHTSAPRDALRNGPFGRIVFSYADLSGAMDHRNALMESYRAVCELLNQVLA